MTKRGFLALVAATVLVTAAAERVVASGDPTVSAVEPERLALPELAGQLDNLAWMRLTHGERHIDFTAIAGRWVVVEKGNYPADPDRMRHLLQGLAALRLVEPKTQRPERFAVLGLDDPAGGRSTLVSLQDRLGDTVARVLVGKLSPGRLGPGQDGVYVRLTEGGAWLARGALDPASNTLDWLDRRIVDIPAARIAALTLTSEGGAVDLHRGPDGHFALRDPPVGSEPKNRTAPALLAAALEGLDLVDVRPAAQVPQPDNGVASAIFTTMDGLRLTLRLFAQDGRDWVAVEAAGADAGAFNGRLAPWVFAITAERSTLLRTRLADLVAPAKGR